MIIDVECEDGTTQIARTIVESEDHYIVHFLERTLDSLYHFSTEEEEVTKESVSGFYDVEELEDTTLYAKFQDGYVLLDDTQDEDYECTDEEESEDESLVDENEEEEA
jgi:hypothetical protein|tara:strand:- start:189 stop:512 length:324 start_codon:yes stop_codon:yes gene_type:complete